MATPHISSWSDIANEYTDALLLGNGASRALHQDFKYESLLEAARKIGKIPPAVEQIFKDLDTTDFEWVQSMVSHARRINHALEIDDQGKIADIYENIRQALIAAITSVHVSYPVVADHLQPISECMRHFKFVISLNYDLIVYWAMLWANDYPKKTDKFKDCFIAGEFDHDWKKYIESIKGAKNSTLVFYPHGNLALATESTTGNETKVAKGSNINLLASITKTWEERDAIPLFVSEGESRQKLRAIMRSPYLSTVYNSVLPNTGSTLVIYGSSLGDQDSHIVNRLCSNKAKIAISIHDSKHKQQWELRKIRADYEAKVRRANRDVKLSFFDSESPGCWPHIQPTK